MLLPLLIALGAQSGSTLELYRGAPLAVGQVRYWDVEDTTIDGDESLKNLGGEYILTAGKRQRILIRFGDLERTLKGRKVESASLVLSMEDGDNPKLSNVSEVLVPWGEGPMHSLAYLREMFKPKPEQGPGKFVPDEKTPFWAASWRDRRGGVQGGAWQNAGATGQQDSRSIPGVKASISDKYLIVEGLTDAIQRMADHPTQNFGFLLEFSTPIAFASSQARFGRPTLRLELSPEARKFETANLSVTRIEKSIESQWIAHVVNTGSAPSKPFNARWVVGEKPGSAEEWHGLAPGEEATFSTQTEMRQPITDHRSRPVEFRIEPTSPNDNPCDNSLVEYESAWPVKLTVTAEMAQKLGANLWPTAQSWVHLMNEVVLPQSRFSFALEGALQRIRLYAMEIGSGPEAIQASDDEHAILFKVGLAMGLLDLAPVNSDDPTKIQLTTDKGTIQVARPSAFAGLMHGGDTRFDGLMPIQINLTPEPFVSPLLESAGPEKTDLLSATDIGLIAAMAKSGNRTGGFEKLTLPTVLVKPVDFAGRDLSDVQLDFFQVKGGAFSGGKDPLYLLQGGSSASLVPSSGGFFGELAKDGSNAAFVIRASAYGVTRATVLPIWRMAEAAYKGNRAGVLDLRFNLPSTFVDDSIDLAEKAKDVGVGADGAVTPGSTIEIDLGRDVAIGEILVAPAVGAGFWDQFEIKTYGSNEKGEAAKTFAREADFSYASKFDLETRHATVGVPYRGKPTIARYIQIFDRSLGKAGAKIGAIRAFPVKG